jgi:hypothetical protein
LTICYSPRGYALLDLCTSVASNATVNFNRRGSSAQAIVRPLGQVMRP